MSDLIFDAELLCEDEASAETLERLLEGSTLPGECSKAWESLAASIAATEFDVEVLSRFERCLSFLVTGSPIRFEWNDWAKGLKAIPELRGVLEIVNDQTGDERTTAFAEGKKASASSVHKAMAEAYPELALVQAIESESERRALQFVSQVDPNRLWKGRTLLGRAVVSRIPGLAAKLLASGADVNLADTAAQWEEEQGRTPLHWACDTHSSAIELLLKAGADVNAKTATGDQPLHILAGRVLDEDALRELDLLLDAGAELETQDDHGHTPLLIATIGGATAAVQRLVAAGARRDAVGPNGGNLRFYAGGKFDERRQLQEQFEDLPYLRPEDLYTGEPEKDLHAAVRWLDVEMIDSLLESADPEITRPIVMRLVEDMTFPMITWLFERMETRPGTVEVIAGGVNRKRISRRAEIEETLALLDSLREASPETMERLDRECLEAQEACRGMTERLQALWSDDEAWSPDAFQTLARDRWLDELDPQKRRQTEEQFEKGHAAHLRGQLRNLLGKLQNNVGNAYWLERGLIRLRRDEQRGNAYYGESSAHLKNVEGRWLLTAG